VRGSAFFDVFCVKINFGVSAVASLNNQKTNILGVILNPYGEKKSLVGCAQNFALGRYPGRNHRCKFGGRSVKPFRGEGSNFRLFHRFRSRPYNTLALPCECVIPAKLTRRQSWSLDSRSIAVVSQNIIVDDELPS